MPVSAKEKNSRSIYVPGLAALKFKPNEDWSYDDALSLYHGSRCSMLEPDTITFSDCIKGMDTMPPHSVDLIIADPPFGINFPEKEQLYHRKSDHVIDSYQEIEQNYGEFTYQWIMKLPRIMRPHATAYVFSGWTNLEDVLRAARLSGLTVINHIIWKYQFGVYTKKKFVTSHYHILMLVKDSTRYYFNKVEHYPQDVWEIKRVYRKGAPKNATTLPVELVKKCIEFSSRPGDLVFDPFMGMATTAVAAKGNLRHFYGFELNELLKPVIEERVSHVTVGEDYTLLHERISKVRDEVKERYPATYKKFSCESGE